MQYFQSPVPLPDNRSPFQTAGPPSRQPVPLPDSRSPFQTAGPSSRQPVPANLYRLSARLVSMIVTPVTVTISNPRTLRSLQLPSTRVGGQPRDQQGGNIFCFSTIIIAFLSTTKFLLLLLLEDFYTFRSSIVKHFFLLGNDAALLCQDPSNHSCNVISRE